MLPGSYPTSPDVETIHHATMNFSPENPHFYSNKYTYAGSIDKLGNPFPPALVTAIRKVGQLSGRLVQLTGYRDGLMYGIKVPSLRKTIWVALRPITSMSFGSIVQSKALRGQRVLIVTGTHGNQFGQSACDAPTLLFSLLTVLLGRPYRA